MLGAYAEASAMRVATWNFSVPEIMLRDMPWSAGVYFLKSVGSDSAVQNNSIPFHSFDMKRIVSSTDRPRKARVHVAVVPADSHSSQRQIQSSALSAFEEFYLQINSPEWILVKIFAGDHPWLV